MIFLLYPKFAYYFKCPNRTERNIQLGNVMEFEDNKVNYEAFGATGDGVTDDMPAICKAHEYANEHGLEVKTKPDATYYIGGKELTATIATSTDWNTSRFIIDDTVEVKNHRASLFEVISLLEPIELTFDRLSRDQRHVDVKPAHDCFVRVENDNKRLYLRRGRNVNQGVPQQDCFVLRQDGTIEADIDWEYDTITSVEANPIDHDTLYLRGGVITTYANRWQPEEGYQYWSRNIVITRSNTIVDGLTHYVVGETDIGSAYSGFLSARHCANITYQNCWATGHRMYSAMGRAGKPVNVGTYDYGANNVVGFTMINCKMNHILDRSRWGVIGTNFCKNILLQDCVLSRMDTHMGVSGTYEIRRCKLGHMGLNAIGRGKLIVEDSTLYGRALINYRSDYGSTWEGQVAIKNCHWIPSCGEKCTPKMINVANDGMHDFGYPCFMPEEITVDGLIVEDTNTPDDYDGMYYFADPDDFHDGVNDFDLSGERPFPYVPCQKLTVRNLETKSGLKPRLSTSEILINTVELIEQS